MDAFRRTSLNSFLNAGFVTTLLHLYKGLFIVIVKSENIRAHFNAAFATYAFLCFNVNGFGHVRLLLKIGLQAFAPRKTGSPQKEGCPLLKPLAGNAGLHKCCRP
jgi:hypothetical protein